KNLLILSIALTLVFAGCDKDEYEETVGVCPLVVSTVPIHNAVDVPPDQVITATFNERMNPETITETSFTLEEGTTSTKGTTPITGTVSYNASTASLVPSIPLSPFTLYTGTMKTLARDLMGNALQTDYVWTFTTIPQVVLSSLPIAGGTAAGAGTFAEGSAIKVTATPNPGYSFSNWTQDGTVISVNSIYEFPMAGNRNLVANFTLLYVVSLSSNPESGGTTAGSGSYSAGTEVTVTASPNAEYNFMNWTDNGTIVSAASSYIFPLNASTTLVANFAVNTYTLNVTAVNGTVVKNPNLTAYNSGATVQLTATPSPGYTFTSWSGDATGSANPLTVTMNANKNVTANFTAIVPVTYTLNVTAVNGTVLKDPNQVAYNSGATVQLTATPDAGYTFTSWNGDATGSVNPLTVIMNADKNITANFTASGPVVPFVDLKTAARFGILSGVGISNNAGFSVINNMDVGISPGARSSVTGFPPAIVVGGAIYAADDGGAVAAMLTQAKLDLTAAYLFAEGASSPAPASVSGDLGGLTLTPGIYKSTSTLLIQSGDLTLDAQGDPNAVWIFQVASGFTTVGGAGGSVILTGGADADNIFWQTGSSAVIGDYTSFYGNILALQSITMNSHAVAVGRMLAQNAAVVLTDTNIINKP
ncbi:MAG: ice-binding family protein, partial [Prolixibacteraceae bacterium]